MPAVPMAPTLFTGHKAAVYALAPGDAPGTFLSADGSGAVVRWHLDRPDAGELVMQAGAGIFSLHRPPARNMLWAGTEHGRLIVADLHARREVAAHHPHTKGIFAFADLPGDRVAAAGGGGVLSVHAPADGAILREVPLSDGKLRCLAMDPAAGALAVGANDGLVRVLEPVLLNETATIQAHPTAPGPADRHTGCTAAAYHPRKPVLITGGKDGHLRLWRTDDRHRLLLELPAHQAAIYRIAFSPDGARFATAARDKSCLIWDAADLDPIVRLDRAAGGHAHSVNTALWAGDVLVTAGDDRTVRAWRP